MVRTVNSFNGKFYVDHYDVFHRLKGKYIIPNGTTDQGIEAILDIMFGADSQITDWYLGLISSNGYSAVADGDTPDSHAGWNEFVDYDETDRQVWSPAVALNKSVANVSPVEFNINADTHDVVGIFCISENTKGGAQDGTGDILWATAIFSAVIDVADGDAFRITYTVSGA